jgi:hypothetical protein
MAYDGTLDPLGELSLTDTCNLRLAVGRAWAHTCIRDQSADFERMYRRLSGGRWVGEIHQRSEIAAGILLRDEWRNMIEGRG